MSPRRKPSRGERIVAVLVLATLAGIVAWLAVAQGSFDPTLYDVAIPLPGQPKDAGTTDATATAAGVAAPLADGTAPAGAPETFGADDLYVKINGKADLYLSAGFVSLWCQRRRPSAGEGPTFEVCVYDMATPDGAFAVFSRQRRAGATEVALGDGAYRTENALFVHRGRYYLELVGARIDDAALAAMQATATEFVAGVAAAEGPPALRYLPREGLRPAALKMLPDSAFGFGRLDDVLLVPYTEGDEEVGVWVSLRAGHTEAETLSGAYVDFLVENGGREIERGEAWPEGLRVVEILGFYEAVIVVGPVIGGVHEAASEELALGLARRLAERVGEVRDDG